MTPELSKLVKVIGELAGRQKELAYQAEQQYAPEVEAIVQSRCRNPGTIERLLDGILDFCFDEKMLRLYKKLCRYYFDIDAAATASYIYAYRDMWDDERS